MNLSKPIPRLWVLSAPNRLPDLAEVMAHLPRGCGVVWRDYAPDGKVAKHLRDLARQHHLLLQIGADARLAHHLRCGLHWPSWMLPRAPQHSAPPITHPITASVHNMREINLAAQCGCDAVFIAPIFATPSHPEARVLGVVRATALAHYARRRHLLPIALGGLDAHKWQQLRGGGRDLWHGFAGIGFFAHYLSPKGRKDVYPFPIHH